MRTIRLAIVASLVATIPALALSATPAGAVAAITISPPAWDFGSALDFQTTGDLVGPTKVFTITNASGAPLAMAATGSSTPEEPTFDFEVVNDGCKGLELAAGATCPVTVEAHPELAGTRTALLTVPTAAAGTYTAALSVNGTDTDPVYVLAGPEYTDLFWQRPPHDPATTLAEYSVLRGVDGGPLTTYATHLEGLLQFHDPDVLAGHTYAYATIPYAPASVPLPQWPPTPVSAIPWQAGGAGTYHPLAPQRRFLDTRTGLGAARAKVGAGKTLHLQITGRGTIPSTGVDSVVLNLTGIKPSSTTSLAVRASGVAKPIGSNVFVGAGQIVDNLVTVRIGTGGKIDITNAAGSIDLVADVEGYYAAAAIPAAAGDGGQYHSFDTASRLSDTRTSFGALGPDHYFTTAMGFDPDTAPHVTAVAVAVTAVSGTGAGNLSAWNGDLAHYPTTTSLHFRKATTIQNMAIVAVTQKFSSFFGRVVPTIGIANNSTYSASVVVDILGYYDDDSLMFGERYQSMSAPVRLVDTNTHLGISANLTAGHTSTFIPSATYADFHTWNLALNVTAAKPTSKTGIAVWPGHFGIPTPNYGRIQAPPLVNTASFVMPTTGPDNAINVYNSAGTTSLRVDLIGRFQGNPVPGDWYYDGIDTQSSSLARVAAPPGAPARQSVPRSMTR